MNLSEPRQIQKVQNIGFEDIPEITVKEIKTSLSEIKHNKTPGEDDIVIESITEGGDVLISVLQNLFNACLLKGRTPSQWHKAVIVIMHKKGDIANLRNYRPISLLSHL